MLRFIFLFIFSSFAFANTDNNQFDTVTQTFTQFLEDVRIEATNNGVSEETLNKAFYHLSANPRIIELDRKQPEFTQTFWKYLNQRVSDTRIKKGRELYKKHYDLLKKTEKIYGVNGQFLIAFWGLETNFGNNIGSFYVVRSLATLAYDLRRRDYFKKQLLIVLKLIDENKIPHDIKGSWAGAMGWTQFMPSNIQAYAIDANQNGKLDLWSNLEDVFASSANFLKKIGWQRGEKWGREVRIPHNFDYQGLGTKYKKTLKKWQNLGVRNMDDSNLPNSEMLATLVLPMGHKGPAFLVYKNFYAILNWNRSILYAVAVGHLADRIIGLDKLTTPVIIEKRLSKADVKRIQEKLNLLGFELGEADGIAGPLTRNAVRQYQKSLQLPIDGYVGSDLLQQIL